MGFALLSKHFEDSQVPAALPAYLPGDWKGAFVLLVIVFVLSSFLDNIAAALIGGTMAGVVFKGRVHIGYLAAIVAASNAGGAGSVVGDTTTTMMWIDGVDPLRRAARVRRRPAVALVIFGVVAAKQQHAYSPIVRDVDERHAHRLGARGHRRLHPRRGHRRERRCQPQVPRGARRVPGDRRGGLGRDRRVRARAPAGLAPAARQPQGDDLPAVPRPVRVDDARGEAPAPPPGRRPWASGSCPRCSTTSRSRRSR